MSFLYRQLNTCHLILCCWCYWIVALPRDVTVYRGVRHRGHGCRKCYLGHISSDWLRQWVQVMLLYDICKGETSVWRSGYMEKSINEESALTSEFSVARFKKCFRLIQNVTSISFGWASYSTLSWLTVYIHQLLGGHRGDWLRRTCAGKCVQIAVPRRRT